MGKAKVEIGQTVRLPHKDPKLVGFVAYVNYSGEPFVIWNKGPDKWHMDIDGDLVVDDSEYAEFEERMKDRLK